MRGSEEYLQICAEKLRIDLLQIALASSDLVRDVQIRSLGDVPPNAWIQDPFLLIVLGPEILIVGKIKLDGPVRERRPVEGIILSRLGIPVPLRDDLPGGKKV